MSYVSFACYNCYAIFGRVIYDKALAGIQIAFLKVKVQAAIIGFPYESLIIIEHASE